MRRRPHSTLRACLASSVAALALAPALGAAPASAQIQPTPLATAAPSTTSGSLTSENVEVTGSRLRTSNLTSEAPVTVITAKQIEQSSSQTLEDVLRKIPSIGTEGNFSTTNNGGNGSSCIDLRNLGIARTLVLVDGRRFIRTGFGDGNDCVDLDTIPIAMVDRIEILKDGASSIYGADAVAGVINIITKKNYSGTQINLGGNITASGDDTEGDISATTGFDFDQGRGNVVLSGRYLDRGPVYQKDRDWSDPVVTIDNGPGQPYGYGSGYPVTGRYFSYTDPNFQDQTVQNGKFTPFVNNTTGGTGDRYDYGQLQQLSDREKQGNLAGNAHYDINDHITAYMSAYYTHKDTQEQLAGQPITGNPNTGQSFDIPAGNPYAEALGVDSELFGLRRVSDWGPRDYITHTDTWQVTGGFRGNIVGNWDYDTYYTYGHASTVLHYTNQVWWSHLEEEMGFDSLNDGDLDDGTYNASVCTSQKGCVLANPFGTGSFSKAAIAYASFTSTSRSITQLRDFGGTITNNKLFQLPYGPIGLAVGIEHRGEQGAYHPDAIIESGDSTAAFEDPTGGGFSATEVFGELSIPILKNVFAAKDLSADVSGRWSDYSTFGSVETWKAGLNWSPTRDIRFRANIGTAVREPAISEAYGGDTGSFNQANDPCAVSSTYGSNAGIVA
ncbi:MAG: TonB-dependent receptor domain-containing protein, partial [Janthinobacterium lividum]